MNKKVELVSRSAFVKAEKSNHEAWAKLILDTPKAAALLHVLCSKIDNNSNATVASWDSLATLMGCHSKTVQRNMKILKDNNWVQIVSLGKGAVNAFVLNSTVGWEPIRDNIQLSNFTAHVITEKAMQDKSTLETKLKKIPALFNGHSE